MTASVPLEYESTGFNRYEFELESERARWLRRRFVYFVGVTLAINLMFLLGPLVRVFFNSARPHDWLLLFVIFFESTLFTWALVYVLRSERDERSIFRLTFWLVVGVMGTMMLISRVFVEVDQGRSFLPSAGTVSDAAINSIHRSAMASAIIGNIYGAVFLNHLLACLFLPWTVRESTKTAAWLVGIGSTILLFDLLLGRSAILNIVALLFLPASVLPGIAWCWLRYSRFRKQYRYVFESKQLKELRKDLDGARRIHESSLPPIHDHGPVRFAYVYEPMQAIGGDLVFRREYIDPETGRETFTTVLLDVTGHGIAAALTVNRLVGELERCFAMNPAINCDEIMNAINSYVYYTLASHSIYVTGVACSVCDCGNDNWTLCYANAGHPTGFLRRAGGTCEPMESTGMMLGVLPPEIFDPASVETDFHAGDALVVYTDGASEAGNPLQGMMGISGVRDLVIQVGESLQDRAHWPIQMIRSVARYRNAPPDDDTLIAVIYRPVHVEAEPVREVEPTFQPATA